MARIRTLYLTPVFDPKMFPRTVNQTVAEAERLKAAHDFDTIAFCGMSGAAMAFLLSHQLRVPLLCVRKKNESSHYRSQMSSTLIEGNLDCQRYLLLDDFISSGDTVNHIIDSISKEVPGAKCVAMLMYAAYDNSTYQHPSWPTNQWVSVVSSRPKDP